MIERRPGQLPNREPTAAAAKRNRAPSFRPLARTERVLSRVSLAKSANNKRIADPQRCRLARQSVADECPCVTICRITAQDPRLPAPSLSRTPANKTRVSRTSPMRLKSSTRKSGHPAGCVDQIWRPRRRLLQPCPQASRESASSALRIWSRRTTLGVRSTLPPGSLCSQRPPKSMPEAACRSPAFLLCARPCGCPGWGAM